MKNKKILFILILMLFILILLSTKSNANLYLNSLYFYAQVKENGDMDVTENWNIDVSYTNTLYKTFELDKTKYSNITNVAVSEVGGKNFTKTNTWAYHLTKDYYFGGINNDGDFEISWGVGLDNSSSTRTYKISYTVKDAISKYNDCAEMYWQFLGDDFEIDASRITGTIKLPKSANSIEDIRAWGHIRTLRGDIQITDLNTVEFALNNYSSGNYVEIRIAMPTEMFGTVQRTYNRDILSSIINEETQWANEANQVRESEKERLERQEKRQRNIKIFFTLIFGGIGLLQIRQFIKYIGILKTTQKLIPTEKYEYFREIPNKDSTPADALFLYNKGALATTTSFGNILSATLLHLSQKGYFKVEVQENEKGKEETIITKLQKNIEELEYEEKIIARFINNAIKENDKITIKELEKYIKKHPEGINRLIDNVSKETKKKNNMKGKYDEKVAKEKLKYVGIAVTYIFISIFLITMIFPFIKLFGIFAAILGLNGIIAILINVKKSSLTQKGIDEREKWVGLKKYMEDFSLLNEKDIPAIEIWNEYLVYATAFGIADKVIKQLKIVYPQMEEMSNFNANSYLYLMLYTDFNRSFNKAINSAITSSMSSGSGSSSFGSGGGFSSGGGFGRRLLGWWRLWPEVGGGGRRKISPKTY